MRSINFWRRVLIHGVSSVRRKRYEWLKWIIEDITNIIGRNPRLLTELPSSYFPLIKFAWLSCWYHCWQEFLPQWWRHLQWHAAAVLCNERIHAVPWQRSAKHVGDLNKLRLRTEWSPWVRPFSRLPNQSCHQQISTDQFDENNTQTKQTDGFKHRCTAYVASIPEVFESNFNPRVWLP
jgi:hypothetical protein